MSLKEEFKYLVQEANQKIQDEIATKEAEESRAFLELKKRQKALINLLMQNDPSQDVKEVISKH